MLVIHRKNVGYSLMLKRTSGTADTHADVLVLGADKNVQVSPFSKAPAKVIVLGVVVGD